MPFIASAIVDLPNYANPYDRRRRTRPISVLVPWLPSQPGTGFDIPINGQRTQFMQTGVARLLGRDDHDEHRLPADLRLHSGALNGGTIAAVETQDFLGEVFPCVDPATGDILRTSRCTRRRSTSSPGSSSTRARRRPATSTSATARTTITSDYITSLANGVLLSVNPGAGGGTSRIGDATLFNPALLTQTQ